VTTEAQDKRLINS